MDPRVRCHGMKANPIGYLWSKYECFLTTACLNSVTGTERERNGNGTGTEQDRNADDRGDYNSSFTLRAVKLIMAVHSVVSMTDLKNRSCSNILSKSHWYGINL